MEKKRNGIESQSYISESWMYQKRAKCMGSNHVFIAWSTIYIHLNVALHFELEKNEEENWVIIVCEKHVSYVFQQTWTKILFLHVIPKMFGK